MAIARPRAKPANRRTHRDIAGSLLERSTAAHRAGRRMLAADLSAPRTERRDRGRLALGNGFMTSRCAASGCAGARPRPDLSRALARWWLALVRATLRRFAMAYRHAALTVELARGIDSRFLAPFSPTYRMPR